MAFKNLWKMLLADLHKMRNPKPRSVKPLSAKEAADTAAQTVTRAMQILKEHNVDENLSELINRGYGNFGEIKLDREINQRPLTDHSVRFTRINERRELTYKDHTLEIIVADMQSSSLPDDHNSYYGKLYVYYDNNCVLEERISRTRDEYSSSYGVHTSEHSLQSLKLGDWLSDLEYIVRVMHDEYKLNAKLSRDRNLINKGKNIDLGKFK